MKLFFTAGTQFPFYRLEEVIKKISLARPDWELVFQTGPGGMSEELACFGPITASDFFEPAVFDKHFSEADMIVTHAGMGNVISCLEKEKRFVMFPRMMEFNEHRNNHQVDGADAISKIYNIPFFLSSDSLLEYLCHGQFVTADMDVVKESISRNRNSFSYALNDLVLDLCKKVSGVK